MIQSEVSILRRVKHPNIVLLIEEMDTNSELYLVMELVKVLHVCWFWGINVKLKCCKSCILGLILKFCSIQIISLEVCFVTILYQNQFVFQDEVFMFNTSPAASAKQQLKTSNWYSFTSQIFVSFPGGRSLWCNHLLQQVHRARRQLYAVQSGKCHQVPAQSQYCPQRHKTRKPVGE